MTSSYHLEDRDKSNKDELKTSTRNIPKLRFKEYNDEWKKYRLKDITTRITRKNKKLESDRPLTISAIDGLIDQKDYFNRQIASKDMSGYYLLKNGEFAYNKSYSNGYPYGSIKRLNKYDKGALSTLYICFSLHNTCSDFLEKYFETDKWYKEIYMIAVEGARNHGLLNISVEDFFNTIHKFPTLPEQQKIASFLTLIDKKIEKQKELVELLKKYKRGLLSQIFSQKLRFKEFDSYWEHKTLKSITTLIKDGTHGSYKDVNNGIPLLSAKDIESGKVIIPADCRKISIEDYKNIYKNYSLNKDDILITIVGTIGRLALVGELKQKFALQRSVGILRINENNNPRFISYVLQSEYVKKQFYSKVNQSAQGGIYLDTLGKIDFYSPSLREQEKIANIMLKMDNIIEKETNLLNLYNDYKKGLLQKMFI